MNPIGIYFFAVQPVLVAVFFLAPPIIGFAYIRVDADRDDQPGWLWALSTVFLSWLAVLAYLVV